MTTLARATIHVMAARARCSPSTIMAVAVAAGVLAASVAIGVTAFQSTGPVGGDVFRLEGTSVEVCLQILGRNLGAGLLLFSGFVTAGTTTLMGLVFIGTWVGAGSAAVSAEVGLSGVSPLVVLYLPLEFGGLLLASGAGLLPLVRFIAREFAQGPPRRHDSRPSHATSLRLGALGGALIGVGAVVETLVILLQT
ncbi:hypothetical protein [Intrasporangium sp.]|uniref:hypothetical protein n=1 Tax=Intrasporangium sp. TaxID=1925024 RepID=UPI00293A7F27|nr:hypothetical protein [Intrasporangium sp.]MDV3220869.1 hypothetical protein [Intrasporangium sp.]